MHRFGGFENKDNLGKLHNLPGAGEEIVVDCDASPGLCITAAQREATRAAMRRIRERAAQRKTGPFNWEEWKAYRDEGRR